MDQTLRYYRLDKNNKLLVEKRIDWQYPVMLHDFVTTENYAIFPLFPCAMSFERMQKGQNIFMWEGNQLSTWFIITDKDSNKITRLETDPCYVYHFGNAFEYGNDIIIDAMVGHKIGLMSDRNGKMATRQDSSNRYARWVINIAEHKINLIYFDERSAEFPRFDKRFTGLAYQYLYAGARATPDGLFDGIVTYQAGTDHKGEFIFGNDFPSEPVFVPSLKKEGDGYLLTIVYRSNKDRSDVVILNPNQLSEGPIATIKLPHRIPYGFHGNFIDNV